MKLQLAFVCLTALQLAACGGSDGDPIDSTEKDSDDNGTGGKSADDKDQDKEDPDDTDPDQDPDTEALAPKITVSASAPGLVSSATADIDKDTEIEWTIKSQPKGSELESSSLDGAAKKKVAFTPQIDGTYVLIAKLTRDGEEVEKEVKIKIKGYDIPFSHLQLTGEAEALAATHQSKAITSGQGNLRDIGCAYAADEATNMAGDLTYRAMNTSVRLPQSLDEDALIYSRILSSDEEQHGLLEIAKSTTHCEDAPPTTKVVGGEYQGVYFPFRISPSGERFMGVSNYGPANNALYTWSEAETAEDVRFIATGDLAGLHQAWINETSLAAITFEEDEWLLRKFDDVSDGLAAATVIMDCSDVEENQQLLPSNQFAFRDEVLFLLGNNGGLYALDAVDGIYSCDAASEQNVLLSGDHSPVVFDVDMNGERVTFEAGESPVIYVAPANADSDPVQVSPMDDPSLHREPHFALGGEQIVWTSHYTYVEPAEDEGSFAEGNLTRVHRVNADGSSPFVVWTHEVPVEQASNATIGSQAGTGCSFALPIGGGPLGAAGFAFGLGLMVVRRRRIA